jgi:hypothetical protein
MKCYAFDGDLWPLAWATLIVCTTVYAMLKHSK